MKEQDKMPSGRMVRTGKFVKTGAQLGANYLKAYGKKVLTGNYNQEELDEANATDVYKTLSELKGSALKVAQMLSMDQGVLPQAYSQKFAQAQYSAPPLSYPLVIQTFKKSFGKSPLEIFDSFSKSAVAAASIGQVHLAEKEGQKFAVKIQYPGVADSIDADLKMVKPVVGAMFNITSSEMDHYLGEVRERLLEETDYRLELKRSLDISSAFAGNPFLAFPKYYPEFSSERILTMDWLEGKHMNEFLKTNPSQEMRDQLGQALWDFYDVQIHDRMEVHADPHPGNFMFSGEGKIGVIDFGCVKSFTPNFYEKYFTIINPNMSGKQDEFEVLLRDLKFILPEDNPTEIKYFMALYTQVLEVLCRPFFSESFDFSDPSYFEEIQVLSQKLQKDKILRKAKAARGPRDAIYLNRTYFGLYSLLNQLNAKVKTRSRLSQEVMAH